MVSGNQIPVLGEAINYFLAGLASQEMGSDQQEIYHFVRWFGSKRSLAEITAVEIANYAERLSLSDTEYLKKLEIVRAFLIYARKKGWCQTNLSVHLKAKKGKPKKKETATRSRPETVWLSQQGYQELTSELEILKIKRLEAIDEVQKAAADKDFRENVPLDAAKEKRGKLEGQIIALEDTLKAAAVIDRGDKNETGIIDIGDSVVLLNLDSGEELHYTLVSPKEVDPVNGKISGASPIGKAVIGKGQGETVEVTAPAGKLRYQIKQIE